MRCDDDIPAKEVVELGETPYHCYYQEHKVGDHQRVDVYAEEPGPLFL